MPLNSQNRSLLLVIAIAVLTAILTVATGARADGVRLSKFQFFQTSYAGIKDQSFSEAGVGFGIEGVTQTEGNYLSRYVKGRLTSVAASQEFLDNTSKLTSAFKFYQGQLEIGGLLYPIRREKKGINLFLGAGGALSLNYISLDTTATLTTISKADQSISGCAVGSVGGEWYIAFSSRTIVLTGEVQYRVESTTLLKQSAFDLSGVSFAVGLGF